MTTLIHVVDITGISPDVLSPLLHVELRYQTKIAIQKKYDMVILSWHDPLEGWSELGVDLRFPLTYMDVTSFE